MNKERFMQYIKDFNNKDYEEIVSTYYTDDIIFETPDYRHEGKEEVLRFFEKVRKGAQETITVENLLIDGGRMAAELWADWTFTEDKPDFTVKPMKKGDSLKVLLFVFYKTINDKISHIKFCRYLGQR